ncbi:MAG: AAA family ATPase [Clostridia bacterium]|nr:AAA family ATPase [Clostridia bacterium]
MKKTNELNYNQLKMVCNPERFEFTSTADLDPIDTGIGQDRGIKALEFGLNVDVRGYNLYVEGPSGVGKTMYTRNYLDVISKKKKAPQDWCYIYNFDNPNEPVAVSLPAGGGKEFCDLMDHFIDDVKIDIKSTFNNEEFEKERALIKQEFEEKRNVLMEKLNQKSSQYGFQVKASQTGIYMMPVVNGKTIAEEEFNKLDEDVRREYEDKSGIVQQHIMEAIGEIKSIERESAQKIEEWQSNVALLTVNTHINYIKSKYKRHKKINHFLDSIKKDILKNISHFIADDKNDKQQAQQAQNVKPELVKPWLNYRVNLFVDNSRLEGAPVIMDSNYSYHNIFGKLEYENYYGALKTDYTKLKPGLLHQANGGYIIFQATDLLSNSLCYEALKKALRTKELGIENAADPRSSMVMISLKPEPIPLNLKVIIIGEENIYQTLLAMDNDFRKLFKIKVEFADDAPLTTENVNKLARFIAGYCTQEELPPLTKEAVAKMIEYASKIADNQEKLSTRFSDLAQIIGEAATWARMSRSKTVNGEHVEKALKESVERVKKYDSRYMEMIEENTLLIETSGFTTGQINGLTVMNIGTYSFGKPVKITANTYTGKSGIINVEREVELSGSTHSKGVLILSGYLGEMFAQDIPLSLTASICFEQLYSGVDGDSASSTELYAILSSLASIPINQAIAVTGSVNQKGEIQPIGGVNDKIEGFFQICKMRGLDGTHGVMIPKQNVRNLNLSEEIVQTVKEGKFHIYAISNIEEGIEILTGVPAGKKDSEGHFPAGSINYLAYEKLKKYAQISQK